MSEIVANIMNFTNFQEGWKFCEIISRTSMCPKHFIGKPGDILMAIQYGKEIGFQPIQSLQSLVVIKGKITIPGDTALALCKVSPDYEYVNEEFSDETMTAVCKTKRKGEDEKIATFSQNDAIKAGLWGKKGQSGEPTPWITYPKRMLRYRALGFGLRDTWPHVLKGLVISEEAMDYETKTVRPKEKVINPKPKPDLTPVNKETYEQLLALIQLKDISQERIDKYVKASKLSEISKITQQNAVKLIDTIKSE